MGMGRDNNAILDVSHFILRPMSKCTRAVVPGNDLIKCRHRLAMHTLYPDDDGPMLAQVALVPVEVSIRSACLSSGLRSRDA